MKVIMENCSADRERWLSLRKGRIGSSDIPAIVGLDSYISPYEKWAEWTGKIARADDNDHMWLGREMEPVIGRLFARRTGFPVERADCLIQHQTDERFQASPDFWVLYDAAKRILEAKNANWKMREKWRGGAPVRHVVQLNWQLGCCGIDEGHVAGLLGGSVEDFEHDLFRFDPTLFELCAEAALNFLEHVQTDTPPAPIAGDAKLIATLQGEREARVAMLSEDARESVDGFKKFRDARKALNAQLKEIDEEYDRFKGRLLLHLGTAAAGRMPNGEMVYARTTNRKEYVVNATTYTTVEVCDEEKKPKRGRQSQ